MPCHFPEKWRHSTGQRIWFSQDLASDASIDAFAKQMETKYGQLDVLVNNAAIAFKVAGNYKGLQGTVIYRDASQETDSHLG